MKKIRIGIIGFGNRGYSFARPVQESPFNEMAEIAAVYDPVPEKLEFARHICKNAIRSCGSMEEFLNQKLDLVMVTTQQSAHAEATITSLNAGFDTFCDKPMARTAAECRAMMAAEKSSGKNLFIGFNLRSHPVIMTIMELINTGRLGHLQQMNCVDNFANGYTYFQRWHRFVKNSGGLTVEKGCHSIDLMNMFAQSNPVRVAAFGGLNRFTPDKDGAKYCSECKKTAVCPYFYDDEKTRELIENETGLDIGIVRANQEKVDMCPFNSEKDTFDNAVVMIEYANGCRASMNECFTSSVKQCSGRQFMLNGWNGQIWAFLDRRSVHFYQNAPGSLKAPFEDVEVPVVTGTHGGADPQMLHYIFDCLSHGLPNTRMPSSAGYYAVAVAEAAEIAIREKRLVDIEPL